MKTTPKEIKLTKEEADALKSRLSSENELTIEDKELLSSLVDFSLWLSHKLELAKYTIAQLKKFLTFRTEKNNKKKSQKNTDNSNAKDNDASNDLVDADNQKDDTDTKSNKEKPNWNDEANHGRKGYDDYPGLNEVLIKHADLNPGDICPDCKAAGNLGKVYPHKPGGLIRLEGQPIVTGNRYKIETFRCHLCQKINKAQVPEAIAKAPKFAPSAVSSLAVNHYYMGLPFYRIEMLQANYGVPLPDATQYDEMAKLKKKVTPVYEYLKTLTANNKTLHYDDTPLTVLALGTVHGTSVVSFDADGHGIYLYFTSEDIAGKEVSNVLKERDVEEALITMTDASNQNHLSEVDELLLARLIVSYCLVHGRRKFFDLLGDWPNECQVIIDCIATVYANEAHCKQETLTPEERLLYHQRHSQPAMDALKTYLTNLWQYGGVEHNSRLGDAVKYMLRHWSALTRFLKVAGCPLDNSICERAIKVFIRYRKNSLFYKTTKGARCGDTLMSLIHTAVNNKMNAFDYLNALQIHTDDVALRPEDFLPWNYQSTLESMNVEKAA